MLKARATRNQGGVVIRGTGEDLEELYGALNTLMEKRDGHEDGEVPQSGTNLRISSLCYDLRHALPVPINLPSEGADDPGAIYGPAGDAGKILSFETGKELPFDLSLDGGGDDGLDEQGKLDALEGPDGTDLAGPGEAGVYYEYGEKTGLPLLTLCEFPILWPELIFVCLLLREYLGSRYDLEYGKKLKGLDWTLEWVTIRRFQIVVLDCLCLHVSPGQAKSIRKIFLESYPHMSGYCTQYVDKLTNTFARKNAEQRLKLLSLLPRRIMAQGNDYRSLEAQIRKTAREYGCPPWELSLVEEIPEDFEW